MKKNKDKPFQFSIGLWSISDVEKISNKIDPLVTKLNQDDYEKILRRAISKNLFHIRNYISDFIESELEKKLLQELKEYTLKVKMKGYEE